MGRHMNRLDVDELANASVVAPSKELPVGPHVGFARVRIADGDGEELEAPTVTAAAACTAGRFSAVKAWSPGLAALGGYNVLYVRLPSTPGRRCESRGRRGR